MFTDCTPLTWFCSRHWMEHKETDTPAFLKPKFQWKDTEEQHTQVNINMNFEKNKTLGRIVLEEQLQFVVVIYVLMIDKEELTKKII